MFFQYYLTSQRDNCLPITQVQRASDSIGWCRYHDLPNFVFCIMLEQNNHTCSTLLFLLAIMYLFLLYLSYFSYLISVVVMCTIDYLRSFFFFFFNMRSLRTINEGKETISLTLFCVRVCACVNFVGILNCRVYELFSC